MAFNNVSFGLFGATNRVAGIKIYNLLHAYVVYDFVYIYIHMVITYWHIVKIQHLLYN